MSDLQEQLGSYTILISHELKSVATRDCFVVLYTDFIYNNVLPNSLEFVGSTEVRQPTLHITFCSYSKRRYAKKVANEIRGIIECIDSSFIVKIHVSWTAGTNQENYNHLKTTRAGASIITYIDGGVSLVQY